MKQVSYFAAIVAYMASMSSIEVNGDVINITEGSTVGYTMTDGNTYIIQNSVSFSNSTAGGSGINVDDNATVVIYVPADITLTSTGANGSGRTGGGAGIRVPQTATLIITGEGTVCATGGNAGNGEKGASGGSGSADAWTGPTVIHYDGSSSGGVSGYASSGAGGRGGCGGGGAGAAIGGSGGTGGIYGETSGGSGSPGEGMGTIYAIGRVNIVAVPGDNGTSGGNGATGSADFASAYGNGRMHYWGAGGGGGGGGGGAGAAPEFAIGGGGSSGGAGGNGKRGTSYSDVSYVAYDNGETGGGGKSAIHNGSGGSGYAGGAAGAVGDEGTLYISPTASVNVNRSSFSATTHPAAQYAILFDANGGTFSSQIEPLTATLGCALPECCVQEPQKDWSLFGGWAKNQEGTEVWYGPNIGDTQLVYDVTESVTLYAIWNMQQFTVTFDANGGEGGWSEELDYDSEIVAPTVSRVGHTFIGWLPEVAATVPSEDVTYVAQWGINQYTATFDANGGAGGGEVTQNFGTELSAPAVTRVGYDFMGWTPEVPLVMTDEDVTYTAQWVPQKYVVTFNANGGEGGWSEMRDYDSEIVPPTVTRIGYDFAGWKPNVAATVPNANVTYTAQWVAHKHTVTFDANGGDGGWSELMDYGVAITPPSVERLHYSFIGWQPAVAATVPDANVLYVAQWKINSHVVTFDANGGVGGWSLVLDYAADIIAPTVSRIGYTFSGWSPAVAATVPDENVTYVAQWTPKKYRVTFDANGGEGGWSEMRDYDSKIVAPVVTRTGYSFNGWNYAIAETVPNADVEYVAQWVANRYRVTFDANGGTGGWSEDMDYGSAITAPIVTRVGYKFKGWSQEVAPTVPDADVTYVAQWALEKYLVTFDANGGEGGWVKVMGYNSDIVAPTVTRTGYDFVGWLPDVADKVPNENVSYVAQWTIHKHTVTFDANGGEGGWSGLRDYGTAIVAPEVTRSGYEFIGWSPEVAATVPDEDVCYVAQWEAKTYKVRFMPNGGDGVMEDETFTVNVTRALPNNLFSREGYVFFGWAGVADGNVAEYEDCETVANLSGGDVPTVELFAVWARNPTNVEIGFGGDKPWRLDKAMHNGCLMWRSGDVDDDESSYAECTVSGPGTVSFWWKSSCEGYFYGSYRLDGVTFAVDGDEKAYANGETDWTNCIIRVNGTGSHTLTWTYEKDVSDAEGDDCAWLSEVVWTPIVAPSIDGDDGMTVDGDSESGFIVIPSKDNTSVVVTIPEGVDSEKVTVEVSADVETVKANGAKVKVMNKGHDISAFLDLAAVTSAGGVINLAEAKVTDDVVKEALDTEKGADIKLSPTDPSITTANTRPGLKYTFVEGRTIEELAPTEQYKWGDNTPFKPTPSIKGGISGFYTIKVEK